MLTLRSAPTSSTLVEQIAVASYLHHYRHNKHSLGSATVHLVWIPKRRKPVLVGDVKLRFSQIMTEVANEKNWIIEDWGKVKGEGENETKYLINFA